jgi:hypothetical protein
MRQILTTRARGVYVPLYLWREHQKKFSNRSSFLTCHGGQARLEKAAGSE